MLNEDFVIFDIKILWTGQVAQDQLKQKNKMHTLWTLCEKRQTEIVLVDLPGGLDLRGIFIKYDLFRPNILTRILLIELKFHEFV